MPSLRATQLSAARSDGRLLSLLAGAVSAVEQRVWSWPLFVTLRGSRDLAGAVRCVRGGACRGFLEVVRASA